MELAVCSFGLAKVRNLQFARGNPTWNCVSDFFFRKIQHDEVAVFAYASRVRKDVRV